MIAVALGVGLAGDTLAQPGLWQWNIILLAVVVMVSEGRRVSLQFNTFQIATKTRDSKF